MYFDIFSDRYSVLSQFEVKSSQIAELEDAEFLFAAYGGRAWEGAAIVIYTHDGKLFEVNGSHCSCYGLERQWKPEETSWGALAMRKLDREEYSSKACEAFTQLIEEHTKETSDGTA